MRIEWTVGLLAALLCACRVEVGRPGGPARAEGGPAEVWIYTSLYQHVIDDLADRAQRELPGIHIEWFQSGSEKIAQRWEAEHEAGGSRACLLATSDPGWYVGLAERDLLRPYVSPRALDLPRPWVTPHWAAFRLSAMVLAATSEDAPGAFSELADPQWKDRFSTGDPLSSGTTFTTVAAWDAVYGADFLARLKENGWVAAGGSSAVLSRMESGERPVGVILLENLLVKPGAVRVILPEDGAVMIPGPLAIPTDCPDPDAAEQVYDWLLGEEAQAAIVRGQMHSPFPGMAAPAGAPPLSELKLFPVEPGFFDDVAEGAEALKTRLQDRPQDRKGQ